MSWTLPQWANMCFYLQVSVRRWKLIIICCLAHYQAACWEQAAVTVEEVEVLQSLMGVNWACAEETERWVAAEKTSLSDGKHSFQ